MLPMPKPLLPSNKINDVDFILSKYECEVLVSRVILEKRAGQIKMFLLKKGVLEKW